ncbi:bifunctional riboflavin kinase/FAD synthetase [Sulfurovum sp. NBC37-1]|uniref:bifunctional riboflavin kinase/FAD synthetase n=1 Tax=Sulfurovum sp. (strain NBC37-1) TaxID=387093 RepID=UPI00015878F8|nr:bifunctional riboflavin kinase/FAD synthetase [Sulfurovum sp. NBC37-1]BAF71423.1 riboflavin biosynthesis regulatory protein RibF [Sulfurovum sp. NBC37-1]
MKIQNNIRSIAIGSFDGMHVAHMKVVEAVDAIVVIERNGGYLTPGYKRSLYTDKMCCFYFFDTIKSLSPEDFVEKLNEDFPRLERIVVGYDFAFGKNKAGSATTLRELFDKEVVIVDEICLEGIPVHSRTIKAYLREGNIYMANKLLGRHYSIKGRVIPGQGLGKKALVPTLNLKVEHYQLPLEGVYATQTKIGSSWYHSVSFLGHRVSTDGSFAVETHIIDKDIGMVEGEIILEFRALIRKNRKFDTLDMLKGQIEKDIERATALLNESSSG